MKNRFAITLVVWLLFAAFAAAQVTIPVSQPRTYTRVLAASNSLNKAGAILCDGTDDEAEITAAITAVNAAGGGTVFLRAGIYYIGNPGIWVKSNVTIQGEGWGTILRMADNAAYPCIGYDTSISEATLKDAPFVNITVRDIQLDGASSYTGSYNGTHKGFRVLYIDGLLLSNIYCHHFGATGLGVDFVRNGRVVDCVANYNGTEHLGDSQNGGNGIGMFVGGWTRENTVVSNCHCTGNGNCGFVYEMGREEVGEGHKIINCYAYDNVNHGIKLNGGSGVTIANCSTISNDLSGIALYPQPDVFPGSDTNQTTDTIISNHISTDNTQYGLVVSKESGDDFSGQLVQGLQITNSRFTTNGIDGMNLNSARDVRVTNSRFNFNGRAGVSLRPSFGNVEDVQFSLCQFRSNATNTGTYVNQFRAGALLGVASGTQQVNRVLFRDCDFSAISGITSNQRFCITFEDQNHASGGTYSWIQVRGANMEGSVSNRIQIAEGAAVATEITNSSYQDIRSVSPDAAITTDVP